MCKACKTPRCARLARLLDVQGLQELLITILLSFANPVKNVQKVCSYISSLLRYYCVLWIAILDDFYTIVLETIASQNGRIAFKTEGVCLLYL